ncbi:MAG: DUF3488 domain-containing protein [Acidobacteria bacterium]|nr:DUF3488 domain-containing protein [Acidobacteriota bacterium]
MPSAAKSNTLWAVERYFEVMLYLMVLSGFATLAETGQLDPSSVLLVIAALTVRGYLLIAQTEFVIPEQWTNYLILLLASWYCADLFWISGKFLVATVHLILALLVIRLFTARRDRDFVLLAILAFGLVLAASVLTVDSTFLIGFSGFLLSTVATFILFDMRRSADAALIHAREKVGRSAAHQMSTALARLIPVLALTIFLMTLAIFFVLPRLSAGYLSAYASPAGLSTAFSDRVELGRLGEVQQSSSVVMHVEITGDKKGAYSQLLWRGVALNQFDGSTWSNNERQVILPRGSDGRFSPLLGDHPGHRRPIEYRVVVEPLGTNVFFLAARPRWLEGAYHMVTTDAAGALYDLDREHPIGLYQAASDLITPLASELRVGAGLAKTNASSSLSRELMSALQLPGLDPRIGNLAREVTAKSHNDYERAAAIEQYLRARYRYTLDLGHVQPKDPIAYFLFERKRGHCEYFASAMAVMLRTLGIPSRIVNGFRGGDFNDITSQYVVRMRNAHSWVEAYLADDGWISFDPTPANNLLNHGRPSRILLYLDAAASFWREWLINYDFQHQRVLGQQATSSSHHVFEYTRAWGQEQYDVLLAWARRLRRDMTTAPKKWGRIAVALLFELLVGLKGGALVCKSSVLRRALRPERAPRNSATLWYERMTRTLARRGWRKLPAQTPTEFARSIHEAELNRAVTEFTARYEKARFAESMDDARRLPELYQALSSRRRD